MERSTVYLYYTEVLLPVSIVLHDVASSSPLPPSSSVVKGHLTCHLLVVLIIYLLISAKRDGLLIIVVHLNRSVIFRLSSSFLFG